jgi:hypothetical protein
MARNKKKKPVRTSARKAVRYKRARRPQRRRTEPLDELTERTRAELRANNREDWWSG